MAKSDALYDNKRSPKAQQEAKKGDVKTGKELPGSDGPQNDDEEFESVGKATLPPEDPEGLSEEDREDSVADANKNLKRVKEGKEVNRKYRTDKNHDEFYRKRGPQS